MTDHERDDDAPAQDPSANVGDQASLHAEEDAVSADDVSGTGSPDPDSDVEPSSASAAATTEETSVEASESAASESAASESAASESAASDSAASESAASESAASESAASEPAESGSAASESAASGPAASEPAESGSAASAASESGSAEAAPEGASSISGSGFWAARRAMLPSLLSACAGLGGTFLLMSNIDQVEHGPLYGLLTMLVGVAGVLGLLGLWSERAPGAEVVARDTAWFALDGESTFFAPIWTVPLAIVILGVGALIGGYAGLPYAILAALVPLLLSAVRRPALMVFVVAAGLYLPFLGVFGLWDPWETHYGEVAREMLARDDWISLWWAQEDWFWSKPILIFWMEALSMGAFGVDFQPDANPAHPEWAIRLPHFLIALGALLSVFAFVRKSWGPRAGLVTAVVLATTPHFFFLSHQAITDMPFVGNMTMALSMLGLAVATDPTREATVYRWGRLSFSGRHLVIGALSLVILPQILYLISRNVTFTAELPPFGWHGDVFLSGSAGNHGVPGNSAAHNVEPYLSGLAAQPIAQAVWWLAGYVALLAILRRERRVRSLLMFAFYLFCGLAFMAKGIPGFALPGLVALFFLIGSRRWELLLDGHFRVGAGIITVLAVGLPWYVAMFIRHGQPFLERLLIHDHINRLTSGVHGDTGSIEYFIEQLGYGLFPWIALAPLALATWFAVARRGGVEDEALPARGKRDGLVLISLWLASAFTLFSAMTTKFHHYIFPAVPPAALLVGIVVERLLAPQSASPRRPWRAYGATALALLAPVPAVLGVAGLWGDVRGVVPEGIERAEMAGWVLAHPWPLWVCVLLLLLSISAFVAARLLGRGASTPSASDGSASSGREGDPGDATSGERGWVRGATAAGLFAAPALLAIVGRDLSWITDARPQGYERLIHLFVYNYGRPWPTELDFRPVLTGFAVIAVVLLVVAASSRLRDVAVRAFLGLGLAFCVWSLDVYIVDLSPHWGQRELVQRYYAERSSDEEPILAYQMNWKGENFYTGNRVNVFVQLDNRALRRWVAEHPGTTAFVLLERARLNTLRGVLRGATIEEVTDDRFCNKFLLIRATLAERATPSPPTRGG